MRITRLCILTPKNNKFKQTWNGNMTFLLIKFKILKIS